MNTENEKRWFVYIGDHHEGPLSIREVFEKKQQGQINAESYVWKEGMPDWLMLSSVTELSQAIQAMTPVREPEAPAPAAEPAPEPAPKPATNLTLKIQPHTHAETPESPAPQPAQTAPASKPRVSLSRALARVFLVLLVLAGLAVGGLAFVSRTGDLDLHARVRPSIETLLQKAPALKAVFKSIPTLTDVKPEEASELEAAVSGPATEGRIALALSNQDPNRPFFYLTTNLPNTTRFELILIGDPDTLLNRLQVVSQGSVTVASGFGKSDAFLMEGGQPLPKGEYTAWIFESQDQDETIKAALSGFPANRSPLKAPAQVPPTAQFVVTKKFFIGGAKDDTYLTRLKAFHENITQKADRELSELDQYLKTLSEQHLALTSEFQKLSKIKKITAANKAAWVKASSTWTQISGQMDQTIQTWSKETLQNEFFYGKVYELVKNAFQALQALVQLEITFLDKPGEKAAFEIQHGKLLSESRDALEALKGKLEAIKATPKSPSGLPTREGL